MSDATKDKSPEILQTRREIPELLDWRQACAALGGTGRPISRSTLDRLTNDGLLRVVRPAPGIVRWAAEDVAQYIESVRFPRRAA
jgi:predicted DNA-binding transcriptional regulator AlpA